MRVIETNQAPAAIGPYSQGMVSGSTVDFPAPGAAVTMAVVTLLSVSFSASATTATGSASSSF